MLDSRYNAGYRLAKDETELIGLVNIGREAFELLRYYHSKEWHDNQGRWHVVISTSRLPEVGAAVKKYRETNGA
jgi:hypothetical protein